MKKEIMDQLKKCFNLKELTVEKWKDKYGMITYVKELGFEDYSRNFNESAIKLMESYRYATSDNALKYLKKMAKKDNHYAHYLRKREYEVIKVYMAKSFVRYGVVIRFKDNGETRYVIETGLSTGLKSQENMEKYMSWYNTYFTAGGLRDKEVDFIFHGVGHSSTNDLYSVEETEIFQ